VSALRNPAVQLVLRLALGLVFVYASLAKIADPRAFARIVYHYQIIGPSASIPPAVPNAFAVALPFVEALSGVLLVIGVLRREAAALLGLLLVVFLLAVSSALYRGIDIENCGCFSLTGKGREAGAKLLLEDLGLLAIAAAVVVGAGGGDRAPDPAGAVSRPAA
jgi:uncharacterized membrane protein YphA (DoxX/SURF4 family)